MTYEPIVDPADPLVADYVGLSDAEARRRDDGGIFVAEGALVIEQLVRSRYRVRSFLVTEHGLRALGPAVAAVDAPVYLATQEVMEAITGFNFHRGALAAADRGVGARPGRGGRPAPTACCWWRVSATTRTWAPCSATRPPSPSTASSSTPPPPTPSTAGRSGCRRATCSASPSPG